MRVYVPPNRPRPSLLEKLARKIEPKGEVEPEIKGTKWFTRKLRSTMARRILPALDVKGLRELIGEEVVIEGKSHGFALKPIVGAPKGTNGTTQMLDHKVMRFFADGSLRHAGGKLKGKAAVKAWKRSRRDALRLAARRAQRPAGDAIQPTAAQVK